MKHYMKFLTRIIPIIFLFSALPLMAQDHDKKDKKKDKEEVVDQNERQRLIKDSKRAKKAFIDEDSRIQEHLNNAVGYAIFPNVGKGAWILGGAAGNGVVFENGQVVGFSELRQVDVGFQFGGQAFRELIIFRTQSALDKFKKGNFSFEGSASAVVWDKGKGESIQFKDGIGVALMPKAGAMVGISIGGQEFDYRDAD
ncbi:lipid-binding SYLF domain-containing protein [Salinimicrobium gaetbulicola]|uniref:YSC84-related protein n=1 Tax=Salinimicrobium gaetbulicola TaxID=999702 RepID=A0ABW3IHY5_9FLAO